MALERRRRTSRLLIRILLALTAVGTLAYAAFIAAGEPAAFSDAASIWIYHGTLLFASLTCFAGAVSVPDQRGAWAAFGVLGRPAVLPAAPPDLSRRAAP